MAKFIARYIEGKRPYVKIIGPFTREMVTSVLASQAESYCPEDKEVPRAGQATFLADAEETCKSIVSKLNSQFKEKGYRVEIEYRGKAALPKNKIAELRTKSDLSKLLSSTMFAESRCEVKPEDLEVINYIEVWNSLK